MTPAANDADFSPSGKNGKWEVADIFRAFGGAYRESNRLTPEQAKAMGAIEACRTARLGGHLDRCESCGHQQPSYNSCRNRHCPKCQTLSKERWLEARKAELLPVGYFHLVFTLPHDLNQTVLHNRKAALDILFRAVSQTLLEFGRNPENGLGGKVGFISVLHTWDQAMGDHFHLHCLIPGGALSQGGTEWIPANPCCLFPVKALSKTFRGKFLSMLKASFAAGDLTLPDRGSRAASTAAFLNSMGKARRKGWVVYAKKPFSGPEKVLEYLGRYTHRVAIANHRILRVDNGEVTFSRRPKRKGGKATVTLKVSEFIRRFLLHVLPGGFMKIRHFGFLANRAKKAAIPAIRELAAASGAPAQEATAPPGARDTREMMIALTGRDISLCPCCKKGRMTPIALISSLRARHLVASMKRANTS